MLLPVAKLQVIVKNVTLKKNKHFLKKSERALPYLKFTYIWKLIPII